MQVAIVTNDRGGRSYRTRQLLKRLHERGIKTWLLTPENTVVRVTNGQVEVMTGGGHRVKPDVVLNALYLPSGKGLEIVECFEAMGVRVVNSAEAWRRAKIKPLATAFFGSQGVKQPTTLFSSGWPRGATRLVSRSLRLPIVFKPWRGTLGIGVQRARGWAAVRRKLMILVGRCRPIYLQQFVRNPGRDIRVMVVGKEAIGATYRIAPRGRWKTNVAAGGRPAWCPVTEELAKISIQATEAVGLDIAGVDVIEGPRGYEVLEINAWPNYHRFDVVARVDVAGRLARFLEEQARRPA